MSLTTTQDIALQPDPRKVFIIHGRDSAAPEQMAIFLRSLGLIPLSFGEVRKEMGGAVHVMDVVARGMREAQAVLALFTPDELVSLRQDLREPQAAADENDRWQARPNVLFEAGVAYGIDRERVAFVLFGDATLFSDIAAVHCFSPTNDSRPKSNRAGLRDLLGNGLKCVINTSNEWMIAGDFDKVLKRGTPEPTRAQAQQRDAANATDKWPALLMRAVTNRAVLIAAIAILTLLLLMPRTATKDNPWSYLATQSILAEGSALSVNEISQLLDAHTRDVVIVGQNLQTLLKNHLLKSVRALLDNDFAHVTFVITVPEFYDAIAGKDTVKKQEYLAEMATTAKTLDDFWNSLSTTQRDRVIIYAHPGASSLSAIIRDRDSKERGVIVFTAKWATDAQPDHRLYGVIDRKTHNELFEVLDGYVPELAKPGVTMRLKDLIPILKQRCAQSGIQWDGLPDLR
jgi:hypothetical protein